MRRIHFDYIKQGTEFIRFLMIGLFKKDNIKNPKKILIVNTSLIGDIFASFPAIRDFIEKNKQAEIDLLVTSPIKPVAEKIKGVSKVFMAKSISERSIEKSSTLKEREEISKRNYDLIIVLRLSKEAYQILKQIKIPNLKTAFGEYLRYLKYTSGKNTIEPVKQVREFFFDALDGKFREVSFEEIFNFKKSDYDYVRKLKEMTGREKKIIIHTGSGWVLKHWENDKWAELLNRINKTGKFRFIFVGGDEQEEKDFKIIQSKLDFKIYSLIKKINVRDLLLSMRLSDYFIGIDSGPRNMAHLADLRSITLLGPGPRIYMPYSKKDIIINKSNCKCTASFCLKRETCMEKINVDEVFDAFKKLKN